MTQEIDWSDVSKLELRKGWDVIFAKRNKGFPESSDSAMCVVAESSEGALVSLELYLNGRQFEDAEQPEDVIPHPPKAKTVTLWRPQWRWDVGANIMCTSLDWMEEKEWDVCKLSSYIYGTYESRDFEVPYA